jgi:CheY-like chemotaxis protein
MGDTTAPPRADCQGVQEHDSLAPAVLRLPETRGGPLPQQAAALSNRAAATERLILLAEDDEDILDLVSFRLERSGYRIVRARDGAEAVLLAKELRPALAVLDISMPVMTGLEATCALRADPATAAIPIILLTARMTPADVAAGLAAGATAYVTKPFSPQDLSSTIDGVLDDV